MVPENGTQPVQMCLVIGGSVSRDLPDSRGRFSAYHVWWRRRGTRVTRDDVIKLLPVQTTANTMILGLYAGLCKFLKRLNCDTGSHVTDLAR